jgi:hypothetical protein
MGLGLSLFLFITVFITPSGNVNKLRKAIFKNAVGAKCR